MDFLKSYPASIPLLKTAIESFVDASIQSNGAAVFAKEAQSHPYKALLFMAKTNRLSEEDLKRYSSTFGRWKKLCAAFLEG